jgi:hypothetical protein
MYRRHTLPEPRSYKDNTSPPSVRVVPSVGGVGEARGDDVVKRTKVYSIRWLKVLYVSSGTLVAVVGALVASAPGHAAQRMGATVLALAWVGLAIYAWRTNRVVAGEEGLAVTGELRTKRVPWEDIVGFGYETAPLPPLGVRRLYLTAQLRSGETWRIRQVSSIPTEGAGSKLAVVAAELNERLANRAIVSLGGP